MSKASKIVFDKTDRLQLYSVFLLLRWKAQTEHFKGNNNWLWMQHTKSKWRACRKGQECRCCFSLSRCWKWQYSALISTLSNLQLKNQFQDLCIKIVYKYLHRYIWQYCVFNVICFINYFLMYVIYLSVRNQNKLTLTKHLINSFNLYETEITYA